MYRSFPPPPPRPPFPPPDTLVYTAPAFTPHPNIHPPAPTHPPVLVCLDLFLIPSQFHQPQGDCIVCFMAALCGEVLVFGWRCPHYLLRVWLWAGGARILWRGSGFWLVVPALCGEGLVFGWWCPHCVARVWFLAGDARIFWRGSGFWLGNARVVF